MSFAAELGAVLYEAETLWGEDVTTFTTHRLPVLEAVDASGLRHDLIDPARVVQTLQGGSLWFLGPQSGSFRTKIHATGHGSATSGALTVDAIETYLAGVLGLVTASAASGTTATGGTASALTTAASGTFTKGGLFRLGALGDGRGNGQGGVVGSHVTTTLTSLTAFDAAPSGTDVVYTGENLYLPESASDSSTAITGRRFLLMTANHKYEAHGCWPMSATFSGTDNGQTPYWDIEWGVSWWRYSTAGTFPSTVTSNQHAPAPNCAGSMFVNNVGTATRAKRDYRSLTVTLTLGLVPLSGPGGANQYQTIVGCRRVPSDIRVSWTEDAEAATATPALDYTSAKHMLVTLSPTAGASVSFYMPNLIPVGSRPVQSNVDRVNRVTREMKAITGTDTTSELTMSAIRFFYS